MPTATALGGSRPAAVVAALRSLLPASSIVDDPEVLVGRSRDASSMPAEGAAVVLVSPASTAKVSTVVRVARDHGLPVVAQGALTGLAGGANAVEGAGLLNLSRMNAVLRVERSTRSPSCSRGWSPTTSTPSPPP